MTNTSRILALALAALVLPLAACTTNIQPLKPLQRVVMWVPDDGSAPIQLTEPEDVPPPAPVVARDESLTTQPTTLPAKINPVDVATTTTEPNTEPAATEPATQTSSPSTAFTKPAFSLSDVTTQPAESQPTTTATTNPQLPITSDQLAATTLPANLPPGKQAIKIIDPNQTSRFVYKATYANVWQQALQIVSHTGFALDRHDYRLGVITTRPLVSSQIVEFWKPQHSDFTNAMENTINSQRRLLRLTIAQVPGKPDFYQVAIQVLVERESNPQETLGGPVFIEGSGFGRNAFSLRSDYAGLEAPRWNILGHDPKLEKKLLDQLFLRI